MPSPGRKATAHLVSASRSTMTLWTSPGLAPETVIVLPLPRPMFIVHSRPTTRSSWSISIPFLSFDSPSEDWNAGGYLYPPANQLPDVTYVFGVWIHGILANEHD